MNYYYWIKLPTASSFMNSPLIVSCFVLDIITFYIKYQSYTMLEPTLVVALYVDSITLVKMFLSRILLLCSVPIFLSLFSKWLFLSIFICLKHLFFICDALIISNPLILCHHFHISHFIPVCCTLGWNSMSSLMRSINEIFAHGVIKFYFLYLIYYMIYIKLTFCVKLSPLVSYLWRTKF